MLFEELVEQHRVDLLVVDAHGFTIPAMRHETGIHLGDLLGDQTILRRGFPVAVEFKGYWLEPVQCFTGLVHRLNVMFVPPGRVEDAHHVKLIDIYCCLAAGVANRLTEDAADEAGVIDGSKRACTRYADRDAVTDAWSQTGACLVTDSDVRITVYVVIECVITHGCIKGARRVVEHGLITQRIVLVAVTEPERPTTMGVVEGTNRIGGERVMTDCVVIAAGGVLIKRLKTDSHVVDAGGVDKERTKTIGRVIIGGVAIERSITGGRVVVAGDVVRERICASGTIEKPAGVAKERINASGGVVAAIDIAIQGAETCRRILVAGSEVVKRLETSAGIPHPTGAADKHPNTFPIVGAGYGTVRVGTYRLRHRCKPKTDKHERDEEETPS